jgi:hypothetical protein
LKKRGQDGPFWGDYTTPALITGGSDLFRPGLPQQDTSEAARHWARERDEARGFSINYKRIALAFLAEFVIMGTSLYGALLFSQVYGSDDTAKHMMMLAPISYALIEFCRVPLALSTRTHRSLVIKALAAIGVVAAMGVTVARVSQIEHGDVTSFEVIARYVEALGGRLDLVADFGDRTVRLPVTDTATNAAA